MIRAASRQVSHTAPDPVEGFEHIRRYWDAALGCWNARILPGEYCIARRDEAISTVLGSCISACMRDPLTGLGGMNHFMLPEDTTGGESAWLDAAAGMATRYGSFAMESLLNGLVQRGARRDRSEIKLFGGGQLLQAMSDVGVRNIVCVRDWLRAEGLKVAASDLGDTAPRRVVYHPASGRVLLKHLRSLDSAAIAARERQYLAVAAKAGRGNDAELF